MNKTIDKINIYVSSSRRTFTIIIMYIWFSPNCFQISSWREWYTQPCLFGQLHAKISFYITMTFFPLWIWRGLLQILVTSTATVSHYTIMAISFSLVMIFRKVYWNENWIRIRQDPILLHMNIILLSKKSLLFVKILFILVKYKILVPWITQMRVKFFL